MAVIGVETGAIEGAENGGEDCLPSGGLVGKLEVLV